MCLCAIMQLKNIDNNKINENNFFNLKQMYLILICIIINKKLILNKLNKICIIIQTI